MHGWQSDSTDGPKGGWSCAFGVVAVVTSPTTAECSAAWCGVICSCSCSCSAVVVVGVVVVVV